MFVLGFVFVFEVGFEDVVVCDVYEGLYVGVIVEIIGFDMLLSGYFC